MIPYFKILADIGSLLHYLFNGFAIFILTTSFILNSKWRVQLTRLSETASLVLRWTAIVYLAEFAWHWIELFWNIFEPASYYRIEIGEPILLFWLFPILFGLSPQLFWIRKIRASKAARLAMAILLLFPVFWEKVILILTNLHRDFVSFDTEMAMGSLALELVYSTAIFSLGLALVVWLRTRSGSLSRS